jgi:6-phosphogluconolactonase (cycloisomerase 2 family)
LEYKNRELKYIDTVSCLPEGYAGETTASAIRFDDNCIYVSNRGLDTISVLKNKNGKLVYKDTYSTDGNFPRDFDIAGNHIICTNEKSDSITVLGKQNFNLEHTENNIKSPICVIAREI